MGSRGTAHASADGPGAALRLAIVSTPRAGNMWLRRQLVALFDLEERSVHTPDEVDWDALPAACALQLHWPRTRAFARTLESARLSRARRRPAPARRADLDPPFRRPRAGDGPLARRRARRRAVDHRRPPLLAGLPGILGGPPCPCSARRLPAMVGARARRDSLRGSRRRAAPGARADRRRGRRHACPFAPGRHPQGHVPLTAGGGYEPSLLAWQAAPLARTPAAGHRSRSSPARTPGCSGDSGTTYGPTRP